MNVREIAKSIADELMEHPGHWVQGYGDEEDVGPCGCIMNLINRQTHKSSGVYAAYDLRQHFIDAIPKSSLVLIGGSPSLSLWNDAKGRTVQDVIEVCDRVAAGDEA